MGRQALPAMHDFKTINEAIGASPDIVSELRLIRDKLDPFAGRFQPQGSACTDRENPAVVLPIGKITMVFLWVLSP